MGGAEAGMRGEVRPQAAAHERPGTSLASNHAFRHWRRAFPGHRRRVGTGVVAAGVVAAAAFSLCAVSTALAADSVYWSNQIGNAISFANLDGTGGGDLATAGATVDDPTGVAIDPAAGRIYWANYNNSNISFAKLDGSGGGNLATGSATVNGPGGVAVDPASGRIYWANFNANKISFAKLDGSGGGNLATGSATVNGPAGVAVDPASGRIYWTNATGNKISFAKLDGSGGGDLATGSATVNGPFGVAVDPAAGRIYWPNLNTGKISFAKLDGSGGGDLNTTGATVAAPEGVAVDPVAGRIYWGTEGGDTISFANLDGTGGGDLTTTGATTNASVFPVLLKSPSATGAPVVGGGASIGSALNCSQGAWAPDLTSQFLYRAPASFAYQWSLGGSDIAGATASSITASGPGDYRCRVTATNHAGAGSQTSAIHAVSAGPPAVLATLTVSVSGTGKGTVTASGINCPGDCAQSYAAGTAVTLSAKAASGSRFAGWGGACSGTGGCSLTMNANRTVSASFRAAPPARPNTKITNVKVDSKKRQASFKFKATGQTRGFQCSLVKTHKKATFTSCRSPKTYKHLKPGKYTFEVRAVGPGGTDPSPAKKTFEIKK